MKAVKILLTTLLITIVSFQAHAEKVITINKPCVYLNELTAPSIQAKEVACLEPGEEKYFAKELIQNHLSRVGVNAKVLSGVLVKREGEKVSKQEIIDQVQRAFEMDHPDVEIIVEQVRINNDLFTEVNEDLIIDVDTSKFGSSYAIVKNGKKQTQLYVYVRAFKEGYVSVERIKAGDVIANKVQIEKIDVTSMRTMPLEDVDGLIAKRSMSYGRAITSDLVETMPEIRKGESVRIVYDNNGIKLETAGIAEEDGFIGKMLTVRNINSQKLVAGNYAGNGRVHVK